MIPVVRFRSARPRPSAPRRRAAGVLAALALCLAGGAPAGAEEDARPVPASVDAPATEAAAAGEYLLGPLDQLSVRVVGWDEAQNGFAIWPSVSGDFTISQNGRLMLPLVGVLQAAGRDVEALAAAVEARLQERLGLAEAPSAAISVAQHRPFYVAGDVARPGAYPFSPGLTVLKAVALSGGGGAAGDSGGRREAIRLRGQLRDSAMRLARDRAREARLEAEIAGAAEIAFPGDLEHPDGPEATTAMLNEERRLFEARRESLERKTRSLEELQELLRSESRTYGFKRATLAEQLPRYREAVEGMERLEERGLARSPAVMAQQDALARMEARDLDLETSIFRAERAIREAGRELINLRAAFATDATAELQRVRASMELERERAATSARLAMEAGLTLETEGTAELIYRITRRVADGGMETFLADRNTPLRPDDVLEVVLSIGGDAQANW